MPARALLTVVLVVGLGCGGSGNYTASAPPPCTSANATTITAASTVSLQSPMAFSPSCITTTTGTSITFRNNDTIQHTVTDLDKQPPAFDSGALNPGQTFQHTYAAAGTFNVYCTIHGSVMRATIIVQ
jgi:manganese oxidase